MPPALTGSLTAVQFCYPAELPLTLNKLKRFETGSFDSFLFRSGIRGFETRYSVSPVKNEKSLFRRLSNKGSIIDGSITDLL